MNRLGLSREGDLGMGSRCSSWTSARPATDMVFILIVDNVRCRRRPKFGNGETGGGGGTGVWGRRRSDWVRSSNGSSMASLISAGSNTSVRIKGISCTLALSRISFDNRCTIDVMRTFSRSTRLVTLRSASIGTAVGIAPSSRTSPSSSYCPSQISSSALLPSGSSCVSMPKAALIVQASSISSPSSSRRAIQKSMTEVRVSRSVMGGICARTGIRRSGGDPQNRCREAIRNRPWNSVIMLYSSTCCCRSNRRVLLIVAHSPSVISAMRARCINSSLSSAAMTGGRSGTMLLLLGTGAECGRTWRRCRRGVTFGCPSTPLNVSWDAMRACPHGGSPTVLNSAVGSPVQSAVCCPPAPPLTGLLLRPIPGTLISSATAHWTTAMSLARLVVLVVAVAILCGVTLGAGTGVRVTAFDQVVAAVDKPWVRRLRKAYSDHVGKQLANGRGIWKPLLITMLLKAGVDMVDRYIKGPVRPDGSPIRRQHAKRSVVRFALNTIIFAWAPLEFLFLTALPVVDRIIASLQ